MIEITPAADEDEVAAIVAVASTLWMMAAPAGTDPTRSPRWRFSGRWWARPVTARRERPFR